MEHYESIVVGAGVLGAIVVLAAPAENELRGRRLERTAIA